MNINLLVGALVRQMPHDVEMEVIDNKTHFTLKIINASKNFDNYFKKYYRDENIREIDIYDNEYKKLIELSIVAKRYVFED